MKHLHISTLCLAVALYSGSAFAQHGHMGAGSSHSGAASHDSMNGASSGSSHRMTIDQQLSKNTQLSGKIQKLTGMPAQQACDGFKNLGQCVAAAHVSKNLGISFACMKSDMIGQAPPSNSSCPADTGTKAKSMSLGKAIQTLDPNANSKTEAKKGTQQANQDLKPSSNS
jgi:hypothetical protein